MTGQAPTFDDLTAAGRAARATVPRSSHAEYAPPADRDPLGIIERQNATRVAELVPLRIERMLQSPFAFYRGTAALQAADLRTSALTGVDVVLCGDAHISNFGIYRSPQRRLVFDLNDFDEATLGPWEWDLKRLITSVVIAARDRGAADADALQSATAAAATYRRVIRQLTRLTALERYYYTLDVARVAKRAPADQREVLKAAMRNAQKRTSERVFRRITERAADGSLRFIEQPPTLTHLDPEIAESVTPAIEAYRRSAAPDIRVLLAQFRVTDAARRVVGVGSVGTRCYIVALTGPRGEPLLLQVKEAGASALREYGQVDATPRLIDWLGEMPHKGERVVTGQRILQAVSDPFLGFLQDDTQGYYVRQFRDGNVSIDVAGLSDPVFLAYAQACAGLLARAHAQSPRAAFIGGYLGGSDAFDRAVAEWSLAYADQSLADFQALQAATDAGRFARLSPA